MNYDRMGRVVVLLIAFGIILIIISGFIGMVNSVRKGNRNPSFFGISSSGFTGQTAFKWAALAIIMLIFIGAMAYFVFFIGGRSRFPK